MKVGKNILDIPLEYLILKIFSKLTFEKLLSKI